MNHYILKKTTADVKQTRSQQKLKIPKRIELAEINSILSVPNLGAITGLRNRCMIELMYRAGLRVGEVCHLEIRDLNIRKREVQVWDGKGGDRVTGYEEGTPLDLLLPDWLRRRKLETRNREVGPRKGEFVFCTIKGGPVSTTYMQQAVARIVKKAEAPEWIHPHSFRHTFAAEFLEAGGKLQHLQMLLGHKNISTTQIYMNVRPEDALDAVHRPRRK